jgi:hypothetical protein
VQKGGGKAARFKPTNTRGQGKSVLAHAVHEGVNGGLAGLVQVLTMMWLRTTVNYQYRYGVNLHVALVELYRQGGVARFYKGLPYAMVQGPLCKFGAVASNEGAKRLVHSHFHNLTHISSRIFLASCLGSFMNVMWRIFLMPLDTVKTILQVDGLGGFDALVRRVLVERDFSVLFRGSKATILATFIGHSWFFVHNWLESVWPRCDHNTRRRFMRSASIGFMSSAVSDTLSNSIRVVKTMKQAALQGAKGESVNLSYRAIVKKLVEEGGYITLFGRGLLTRILSNGLQSILFSIVWQFIRRLNMNANRTVKAVKRLGVLETPDLGYSSHAGEALATPSTTTLPVSVDDHGGVHDAAYEVGVDIDGGGDEVMVPADDGGGDSMMSAEYDQYMNMDAFGTTTDSVDVDADVDVDVDIDVDVDGPPDNVDFDVPPSN